MKAKLELTDDHDYVTVDGRGLRIGCDLHCRLPYLFMSDPPENITKRGSLNIKLDTDTLREIVRVAEKWLADHPDL